MLHRKPGRIRSQPGRLGAALTLAAAMALGACAAQMRNTPPPEVTRSQDLAGLPYTPLVYHLDLSILAYQLYSQTLVWPFDPYYEEFADRDRRLVMDRVRVWAGTSGASAGGPRPGGYRGPGLLAGFPDNPRSDPIVYRYDRLAPWRPTISNPSGRWTEFTPPAAITGPVREVYMCHRPSGRTGAEVAISRVASRGGVGRDVILAFEGATGDKGESGQPASQSLIGFVLLRRLPDAGFDVHIAFRGSRSGSAERAVLQGNYTETASGNPDWITDLGWYRIGPGDGASAITTIGGVHRGFATAMTQTLPQTMACLGRAAALAGGGTPRNITVTGHSLGGGLAQHFVSAMLLGDRYGPGGAGPAMPASLRSWPWTKVKLITYGAPTAGDQTWAEALTAGALQSVFFGTTLEPVDLKGLAVHDPSIVPRLTDPARPAGYRVLISTDPVTTRKLTGGLHVGQTVYAKKLGPLAPFAIGRLRSHEPELIRELMLGTFADPRNPPPPMRYREMAELNPGRDQAARGTAGEYAKLRAVIERYYSQRGLSFDTDGLARDFETFLTLIPAE